MGDVHCEPEIFSLCFTSPFPGKQLCTYAQGPKTWYSCSNVRMNKLLYPHHSESAFYCCLLGQSLQILFLHFRNRCSLIRTSWTSAWNLNFWAGHQAPAFLEPSTTPMTWPGLRLSSPRPVSSEKRNLLLVACSHESACTCHGERKFPVRFGLRALGKTCQGLLVYLINIFKSFYMLLKKPNPLKCRTGTFTGSKWRSISSHNDVRCIVETTGWK